MKEIVENNLSNSIRNSDTEDQNVERIISVDEMEEKIIVDKILSDAIENSDAKTQNALGYCYKEGLNVIQDYGKAIECFRKAADKGNMAAQYNLGLCYLAGDNGYFNEEEGIKLLQQIADQGDNWALYDMARYFLNFDSLNDDLKDLDKESLDKGIGYLQQAAERGLVRAQESLGMMYYYGDGIEKDLAKAEYWTRRAAEQTTDYSELLLNLLDEMHIPYKEIGFYQYALIK